MFAQVTDIRASGSKFLPGRSRILLAVFSLILVVGMVPIAEAVDTARPLRSFKVEGAYDDVRFDLESAIVNAGLKIVYNGNIADMLGRTASAVGAKKSIYDNAEFFTFCSSPHSHATMGADPHNVGYCPYLLYVYSISGEKNVTYVGYRRPVIAGTDESKKSLMALDKLLESLIKDAIE